MKERNRQTDRQSLINQIMYVNFTYDCRKEATVAEQSEGHRHREGSEEEYDGEKEDVRDRLCDVSVVTCVPGQLPTILDTFLFSDTVSAHFDALTAVCQAI